MRLVPGGSCGLANRVDESYTLEPLLVGKLDLADEVVEMPDQLSHDESCPLWHIWANGVDDGVGEVDRRVRHAPLAVVAALDRGLLDLALVAVDLDAAADQAHIVAAAQVACLEAG